MKKLTALLLSAVLLLTMLTGCGKEKPEGLFYDLTGMDPAATIVTIDGQEVPVEMYLYCILYAVEYVATKHGASSLNADGSLKWDAQWNEEMTLKDAVLEEALNTVKLYMIVEKWAEEYDVVLDEESEAAFNDELAAIAQQLGGEEVYLEYLSQRGITPETNRRMGKIFYLYTDMLALTKEEGSPLYIEDDVLYQYEGITEDTVLADHILLFYPENEEDRPNVRTVMEEALATIRSDEDPVAAFNFIADNYSEDTGRAYSPNGYLVTEDANFVQSFKDTALSLEEYEISEVIESEYGYHILMRKPLRDYVADEHLADLVGVAMENADVKWSTDYMKFDVEQFYADYQAYVETLNETAGSDAAER